MIGSFIVARSWILILDGVDKRTSDHHLFPALSKGKAMFGIFAWLITGQRVGVRRRRCGRFLGEIVLVAVSKASASIGQRVLDLVESIATR